MASSLITSGQIDGETMETVRDYIFRGSKITADGDHSHEIKRHLLFGRKAMTNLDSILKSRHSVQLSSIAQSCPTLCDPMNRNTPASLSITNPQSPPKLMSIKSVMPSNHLILCHPAFNLSQHQGLFKWVSSSHQVAKVLEFQLHHQSFQWMPRTDLL